MQGTKIFAIFLIPLLLAGCSLRAKTTASKVPVPPSQPVITPVPPPPPPPDLSIPQTQAQLPPPQPVPEEALATLQLPEEDPAPPVPPVKPPRQTVRVPPKAADTPPPAQSTQDPGRGLVGEAIPPEEQNRLRGEAIAARRAVRQRLTELSAGMKRQQKDRIDNIESFMKLSEDLEHRGDLRQAHELALKAQTLVRELR